ncbi:MAG: RluA family pseudouridine synthase [Oscillospiraceae bacterium]|nr:RluA family pseudouridine synthase [Oscillospiraceae bacterium]
MSRLTVPVTCSDEMPLGTYLRKYAGISAGMLKRLKQVPDGITRSGMHLRTVDPVRSGDVILLHLPEHCGHTPNPALPVPVVYESAQVLVCDKPAGIPAHPSVRHREDTLANWFAAVRPESGFHLLNRLDRNTSGLCLIAKTAYAANRLRGQVQKRYYALVPNGLTGSGTVDAPIAREQDSVITRCVRPDGKPAVTHYRVMQQTPQCTLLELMLETGRTHQIRVHMAHIGYPLLGDALYGGDCTVLQTHALHCGMLRFPDPASGEEIVLQAPLRREMQEMLQKRPEI